VVAVSLKNSAPRLAAVVVVDDPRGGEYYGGTVAAPVFAAVMEGALRVMAIAPDQFEDRERATTLAASAP
jgi:cell division protein FtsI (penicillin-binding protein 3)